MRYSTLPDLERRLEELPSPLAVPFSRIPREPDEVPFEAFLRGMDAFFATLKWSAFVAISDVFQKLEDDHPFARRETLGSVFPSVAQILEPRRSHGHWIECVRGVLAAYERHPEWFFVPRFMLAQTSSGADPLRFDEKLDGLVVIRNQYAHGSKSVLPRATALEKWGEVDALLGSLVSQLDAFRGYHLLQISGLVEPDEPPGWFRTGKAYHLRGYNMSERALLQGPFRLRFVRKAPKLRRLYLFNPDFSDHLSLHPFLLFSLGTDLARSETGATFLFNELQEKALSYETFDGAEAPAWDFGKKAGGEGGQDEEILAKVAGPLFQTFCALKVLTAQSDLDRLRSLPGFPRQSHVLSFRRVIEFHTEGFSGRTTCFQEAEHAIAGPYRAAWVKGKAGYGKTAFMAKLAQQNPDAIHYFISPEKQTANASTFLLHACQEIVNRFNFPDVIDDELANQLDELKAYFLELLRRASDRLPAEGRRKLVILVDGLDESERYAARSEEVIRRFLPTRDEIPERVFFAISSRPEEVDLDDIANVHIELEPFTEQEVRAILGHHGWDDAAARTAFAKSAGQPIYFRFLLDGLKTGQVKSDKVEHLPEGITGFYARFWTQCDRDKGQKKSPDKAHLADLQQKVLGLLAAARDRLSRGDLVELLSGPDSAVTEGEIRRLLDKDRLGRFVIGTQSFSLFHDTLREFVLHKTRPNDDLPFGNGLWCHQQLARWCRQTPERPYSEYLVEHLLCSRQYMSVVELLESGSQDGLVARRLASPGGTVRLTRDLAFGVQAARELNDLERVFRFTVMRMALGLLRKSVARPEAATLLAILGDQPALAELLDECDSDDERWALACKVFAAALQSGNSELTTTWRQKIQEIWSRVGIYHKRGWARSLLASLVEPTAELARTALTLLGGLDLDDRAEAVAKGLAAHPVVAAELLLEERLHEVDALLCARARVVLASRLALTGRPDLAWRLVPDLNLGSLGDDSFFALPALLKQDRQQLLEAAGFRGDQDLDDWDEITVVLRFLIMLRECPEGQVQRWLERQPTSVRVLGTVERALDTGDKDQLVAASQLLHDEIHNLPLFVVLAAAALLAAHGPADLAKPWEALLWALVEKVEFGKTLALLSDDAFEEKVKSLLPDAGRIAERVSHFFPDQYSALLFSLAAASPAIAVMRDPEFLTWLRRGFEEGSPGLDDLTNSRLERITSRIAEFLEHNNDRDDIQRTILPVLFSRLADDRACEAIKRLSPIECGWRTAKHLPLLDPAFDVARFEELSPWLVDSDGDPIPLNDVLEARLVATALADPAAAFAAWKALRPIENEAIKGHRRALGLGLDPLGQEAPDRESDLDEDPEYEDDESEPPDLDEGGVLGKSDQAGEVGGGALDLGAEKAGGDQGDHETRQRSSLGPFPKPSSDDTATRLPAEGLAQALVASGFWAEALEVVCTARVGDEIWEWFTLSPPDQLRQLLDSVDQLAERQDLSNSPLRRCIELAVETFPEGDRPRRIAALLDHPSLAYRLAEVAPIAFHIGHGGPVVERLLGRPDCCSDDELAAIVTRWTESVTHADTAAGRDMWVTFQRYLEGRGLEFLDGIQSSFDRMVSALLERGEVPPAALKTFAQRLGSDYPQSRLSAAVAMVRSGWERTAIEPLLTFQGVGEIVRFLEALARAPLDDWLLDRLSGEAQELLKALDQRSDLAAGLALAAAQRWNPEQRTELVAQYLTALRCIASAAMTEAESRELGEWLLLARAVGSGELVELASQTTEKGSGLTLKIRSFATLNPELSWQLLSAVPNPVERAPHVPAVAAASAKLDPEWTNEHLVIGIQADNAWGVVKALLDACNDEAWPKVVPLVRVALGTLPSDFTVSSQDYGELRALLRRQPDLGRALLRKASPPLGWIGVFREESPARVNGEEFLTASEQELEAWALSLRAAAADTAIALRSPLEDLVEVLAELPDDPRRERVRRELLTAAEFVLERQHRQRKDFLRDMLRPLATFDPERALAWIETYRYGVPRLDESLDAIVAARPELLPAITRKGLGDLSDRRMAILRVLAQEPVASALARARREGIDADDVAMAIVESRCIRPEEMPYLERSVQKDDNEKGIELRIKAAVKARAAGCHDLDPWLDEAWQGMSAGAFSIDRWGNVDFHLASPGWRSFRDENSLLAVLYGLKPQEMEDWLDRVEKAAPPEHAGKYREKLDSIRGEAIPALFRHSPAWILARLDDWSCRPFWPSQLDDELFAVVENLNAESALRVLSRFPSELQGTVTLDRVRRILERVSDRSELQECFEVLIAEHLLRAPSSIDGFVQLCLEFAPRAGHDRVSLAVGFAHQFQDAKRLLGAEPMSKAELLATLAAVAEGGAAAAELGKAATQVGELDEASLIARLSDELRGRLTQLDETIRMVAAMPGADQALISMFVNQRRSLLYGSNA